MMGSTIAWWMDKEMDGWIRKWMDWDRIACTHQYIHSAHLCIMYILGQASGSLFFLWWQKGQKGLCEMISQILSRICWSVCMYNRNGLPRRSRTRPTTWSFSISLPTSVFSRKFLLTSWLPNLFWLIVFAWMVLLLVLPSVNSSPRAWSSPSFSTTLKSSTVSHVDPSNVSGDSLWNL